MLLVTNDDKSSFLIDPNDYESVKNIELGYLDSVKNMISHTKMSMHDVIKITSFNPAKYIGVEKRKGSIEVGKDADLLIINSNFDLMRVYCKGNITYDSI